MDKADNNKKVSPIEVEKYLKDIKYPVNKAELIKKAEENNAPSDIVETLSQLNEKEYNNTTDVTKAIGELE